MGKVDLRQFTIAVKKRMSGLVDKLDVSLGNSLCCFIEPEVVLNEKTKTNLILRKNYKKIFNYLNITGLKIDDAKVDTSRESFNKEALGFKDDYMKVVKKNNKIFSNGNIKRIVSNSPVFLDLLNRYHNEKIIHVSQLIYESILKKKGKENGKQKGIQKEFNSSKKFNKNKYKSDIEEDNLDKSLDGDYEEEKDPIIETLNNRNVRLEREDELNCENGNDRDTVNNSFNVLNSEKTEAEDILYHDSCILARKLNVIEEPREVLKYFGYNVLDFMKSKTHTICCGSCGAMKEVKNGFNGEKLSYAIALKLLKQAKFLGVKKIVTSCPDCYGHFKETARKFNVDIEIKEISEAIVDKINLKKK